MDFQRHRRGNAGADSGVSLHLAGVVLKVGMAVVLAAIGLKLTFWAVDVIDQLLHEPDRIAILQPLLREVGDEEGERVFRVESDRDGFTVRDRNAFANVLIVAVLAVLFGVIGRAIAACLGGAVKLVTSIDFGSRKAETPGPPDLPKAR